MRPAAPAQGGHRAGAGKTTPSFKPADARIHLDNLDQLDALLRQNSSSRSGIQRHVLLGAEKRAYCERENAITSLRSKADDVLNTVPRKNGRLSRDTQRR